MSVATYPGPQCPIRIDSRRTADFLAWLHGSGSMHRPRESHRKFPDLIKTDSQDSSISSAESRSKAAVRERCRDDDSISLSGLARAQAGCVLKSERELL